MASYIINISGGGGITAQEAAALLATKQDKLYDSTSTIPQGKSANIKTVNNESLLITDSDTDITINS